MTVIADVLLMAATVGVLVYCQILSRRLRRFNALEDGMGGAIAMLSVQVDDMTRAVALASKNATASEQRLQLLTQRAEALSRRIEISLAASASGSSGALGSAGIDPRHEGRRLRRRPTQAENVS